MCSAETVYRVDTDSDVYFYSTLTTADVIFGGSAVCAFTLSSINQVFSYFLNKKKKHFCMQEQFRLKWNFSCFIILIHFFPI